MTVAGALGDADRLNNPVYGPVGIIRLSMISSIGTNMYFVKPFILCMLAFLGGTGAEASLR